MQREEFHDQSGPGRVPMQAEGAPPANQRLYLSVRTVNNHLQNVYTKLGVSSRAELATVLDRGPDDDG